MSAAFQTGTDHSARRRLAGMAHNCGECVVELSGDHRIAAERGRVFAALCDPAVLMRCITPLEHMEQVHPTRYTARVRIGLGPIKARFTGDVEVEPVEPPAFYVLRGGGTGLFGAAQGVVEIRLTEAGTAATLLSYRLTADVGGRLGAMAARLVQAKAEAHIARFFERFAADITR